MGTPRRSLDTIDNESYSPVLVRESPVKGIHQRGNLTGNVRLVRDLSCDMYNFIQDWNLQHLAGCQLLKTIADKKIESMSDADIDSTLKIYPTGLQSLCDELERICMKLEVIVCNMKQISSQVEAVIQLEKRQIVNQSPLFLTWPIEKFGDTFSYITDSYQKELIVKYDVKKDVAHCKTKDSLMVYMATWIYQPFLSCDLLLESLLLETGLR